MTTLVPQDLAYADSAPWRFDFEGIVTATPAEVWDVFVDNQSWTVWFAKCRSCRTTSATFDGVGSTRTISVSGMRVDERFIAWEPERLWAFTAEAMRMSIATSLVERATFHDLGDGRTRIDYRMAMTPTRWARFLRGIVDRAATKAFAKSFVRLDAYLAERR